MDFIVQKGDICFQSLHHMCLQNKNTFTYNINAFVQKTDRYDRGDKTGVMGNGECHTSDVLFGGGWQTNGFGSSLCNNLFFLETNSMGRKQ